MWLNAKIGYLVQDRLRSFVIAFAFGIALVGWHLSYAGAMAADGYSPKRVFLSGHSLTDDPFGDYLARIAAGRRQPFEWNQQIVIGSPISWRTMGDRSKGIPWAGYRYGKNRNGGGDLNVLEEFERRSGNSPYDTLLLMEGSNTVAVLRWHSVPQFVRHYHERFIAANVKGQTFFLHPWEDLRDKSTPQPWLVLERQAAKIWQCTVSRINLSLENESREDRIKSIPLALALVELVEALSSNKIKALSGVPTTAGRVSQIFEDNVHLTPIGRYYIAVVTDVFVRAQSAVGVWHPRTLSADLARELQALAWDFYLNYRQGNKPLAMPECRELMVQHFCIKWNDYVPSKWVASQPDCADYFGRATMATRRLELSNPFAFSKETDAGFWLPAPN